MPLLDHHRPPLDKSHPWKSFHGVWASAIGRMLNGGVLPPGYRALPFYDHDGPVEIDIGTVATSAEASEGASAWSPPPPGAEVAIEWPPPDAAGVEIFESEDDPRLVAAIELVSPRNKDRASAREAFASKCADHLRLGRGLVFIDTVTTRRADMHSEILGALGLDAAPLPDGSLGAASYRPTGRDAEGRLQVWPSALAVGLALPTLPLWIGGGIVVPLDLEQSYGLACDDLRIRRVR